jgi:hypothetical protein
MVKSILRWLTRLSCIPLIVSMSWAAESGVYKTRLNGLDVGVDEQTGSLVYLSYPATGVILEAEPEKAGLIDLAYPVDSFAPMRLASRFSHAHVAKEGDEIVITWDSLGPSRANFAMPAGKVRARVTIRAAEDGGSVILACRIENKSSAPVPQILFPDLWGLQPVAGKEDTRLRLARAVVRPFAEPIKPADSASFYIGHGWKYYPAADPMGYGGYQAQNALRWLDFGGFEGGLSIFQKKWGTGDRPNILTYRSEQDPMSLRLVWEHRKSLAAGESWESGEFWLTPHPGGWAKGIEVFRNYVRQVNPPRALPQHVRDGLGCQNVWMMQSPERDPAKTDFQFKDLPRVAADARAHGIDELMPRFWCPYFRLPIAVSPELGTMEEFLAGVRQAREIGVNAAPFVSVHIINNQDVARYGVKPAHDDWTYDTELVPWFRPYYTHELEGTFVDDDNPLWQQDVLAALTEWINRGVPSLSWDQVTFNEGAGQKPGLIKLIEQVRAVARAKDPQSTFSGESCTDLELESSVLDYTWNFIGDYGEAVDAGPILSVLRAPRLNCNVEDSARVVKKAFSEGLYLNVMPRKPDGANGSALISSQPEMAAALKEAASLRKQFLSFFVDGVFIGDSVLKQPCSAFVRGYVQGNKLLVIALNDQQQAQAVTFQTDIGLWLPASESYRVQSYRSSGELKATTSVQGTHWLGVTPLLQPTELALFVVEPK